MSDHATGDLLVRAIDEDLSPGEVAALENHLASCEACRRQYQEISSLSTQLESLVAAVPAMGLPAERAALATKLEALGSSKVTAEQSRKRVRRRLGWALAIAASLAAVVLLAPEMHRLAPFEPGHTVRAESSGSFEVEGETFVALPYSNPELSMNGPHIVQMEIPVSSLADAGVIFEPISSEIAATNEAVLADVLLGADGQPLGVHVLDAE